MWNEILSVLSPSTKHNKHSHIMLYMFVFFFEKQGWYAYTSLTKIQVFNSYKTRQVSRDLRIPRSVRPP